MKYFITVKLWFELFRVETVELKYIHIGIGVCVDLPYLQRLILPQSSLKLI